MPSLSLRRPLLLAALGLAPALTPAGAQRMVHPEVLLGFTAFSLRAGAC